MTTLIISVSSSATNAAGTAFGQQPDQLAPSFFDMKVTSSTNPVIGTGVYDAYCINPLLDIFVAPTSYAADSYEASNPTSFQQITPIEADLSSLSQAQVDQLNWILSQNLTSDPKYAGRFNYGEVQVAIWRVLGFTQAEINSAGLDRFLNDNNRQVVSLTDVDFLVNAAQSAVASGQYVSPPPGTNFTMLVDPSPKTGTETGTGIQPLIVQLANAKLGNFVWFDSDADGIQDANESGVDNLVVELWKDGVKVASTVTGDDFSTAAVEHGFYQFAGLAAGDYQVKFVAPDYAFTSVDANLNSQDQEDSDANPATGFSQVVHLNAGESNQTIDAGLVAPGTAKISGYVYEDQGNDGVRNAEPPIAGVTVTLNGTDDLGNAVTASTTTDANGYYEFTGLRPGTYSVTETQPANYLDGKDTAGSTGGSATNDLISAIPLAAGEHSQENNFGELPPAKLSGYVYEDQGNDGVRNAEPPIAGVTITLSGVDDLGNAVNATTTTDANGYYEFTDLRPGTYSVTETQPANYLDGKDTAGSTGGSATNDLISAIPLAAGEHSQENNFGELPPAKLSGYVYEDQGNDGVRNAEPPIAGVTVTLNGTDDLGNAVTASTTTDANGYYEFTGLRPGTYSVTETQPANYLDGQDTAGSTGGSATNDLISAIPLAAGEHSQENNFGELPPAKLSGYVYEDQGNDGVRNAEPPIAGVTVTLNGTDDLGNAVTASTTTDANGYYEFTGLRPGTYSVTETQPANYLDGKDTAGSTGGSATNDLISAIPLAAGEHSQENNFGELPPAKLSGYVYEDQGNDGVRNAEPPIAGVTVTLNGTDDLGNAVTASTTTDANGYYEFTDLRPGTYSVTETQPANYLDGKDTAGSTGGSATNDLISAIPLAAGEHSQENNFGELPPAKLSGYVYEDQGNDGVRNAEPPIAGVTVTLSGTDDLGNAVTASTTTDVNGYYEFTGLRPGTYSVTETQPANYLDGKDTAGSTGGSATNDLISAIPLAAGEHSQENNFGELPPAKLSGYVYEDQGNDGVRNAEPPIAGVTITLSGTDDLGNAVNATTTTDANGYYEFTDLRPGTYSVTETQPANYLDGKDTAGSTGGSATNDLISAIPLAAGEHSQENNFGELPPAKLSGYVYEDQGNDGVRNAEPPIAGVTVTLNGTDDLGNAVTASTTTDVNGYYEFTDLRPGTYSVTETQPANYLDGKDTAGSTGGSVSNDLISAISLAAGQHSQENNFGELPPAKISGYVYEDQGNDGVRNAEPPIAGVTITLSGTDDLGNAVNATTTTDANGYYEFTDLRPGTYSVTETQPANYLDGKDTAGSTGGSATNDLISAIPLAAGEHSQENNFGELPPAKLSGYVYEDQGNDGVRNAEPPIAGVTVTLNGTDDLGNAVNATTTTDASGYYEFTDLRPGTYSVTETQPANYLDGKDTAGSTGGSATNDLISAIPLAAGEHSQENNFGELPPAKLSGYVYEDQGNDGVRNAEPPISGVTVTLNGTDDLGNAVNATTTTDANGYYEFTDLRPGTYSVTETQPANYLDGKDTAGSTGGSATNDLISAIPLAAGEHSQENNFGELPPAKLSGYVYEDQGNDGVRNAEPPIAGVTVTLSGTDDLGNAVTASTTTDANGYYEFTDLRPGTYSVTETQPGGYIDGKDTVGTAGGSNAVNDTLSAIVLVGGTNSVENNFGELKTASLGDRVWYDTNANGQQDFGETGANGVTVTLTAGGADGQLSTTADNTTQTTTTAGDGNYLFTNLTPGQQYQVTFGKPGGYNFTTADSGNDNSDSDADTVSGKSQIVTLANGESNLTIDAGLVAQKAAIGDHVWLDCNANGIQDSGEVGVANVTVKLLNSAGTVIATQQTNANGDYLFSNLNPGDYAVQFEALAGYTFTTKDANGNLSDASDSDADVVTGKTVYTTLSAGETDLTWDAGLTPVCRPVTFDFSGNSSTCGTLGNSRTWTDALTGVSVTARAFSQDKGTNNWQSAFLGAYGGGLGVTDSLEGTGGNNTHAVDNVGRNNYIVLQFSQSVLVDKAFLGYVVNDSDAQIWIGNAANPITSMNNSVLNGALFTEVDTTTSSSARTVDINDGGVRGNLFIIAADTTDTSPEDYFKLETVTICAPDYCAPVAKASLGDFVWEDKNYNGVQDAGENGISGVTVKLLSSTGTVLATTTTSASGAYAFTNLNPGDYKVKVVSPSGYYVTKQNLGGNDLKDSDIDSSGTTAVVSLAAGENDLSVDAGLYRKASVGDKVWEDTNHNWIQDSATDPGIGGVKVSLLDSTGTTVLATTYTNASGNYLFSNLNPGDYILQFDKTNVIYRNTNMNIWKWAVKDVGTNDAIDSDVNGNGTSTTNVTRTDKFTLASGQNDMTRDAAITPIAIDLDGNGIHTVSRANSGGTFDLFGNGAGIHSGWLSGGDGFLAVDKNGNGAVDSIHELFGGMAKGAGFANLAAYDSNHDGVVDQSDANFADLLIWRDANGNHQTDAGELNSLAAHGIASLAVGYTEVPMLDAEGNLHLERSSATLADGSSVDMTDVYFNVSADDAAAAGVTLPTIGELLGNDASLDGLLSGLGTGTATPALADNAVDTGAADALKQMAALYDQTAIAA